MLTGGGLAGRVFGHSEIHNETEEAKNNIVYILSI